ncbi:YbjN domain-containing protein [Sphingomicrobium sediminis]|uniref:YbjN domain-containing protein n=1 Tax=Sphingomicrobium sediminis TaxID=2950949 RepID=A0A9X2EK98_9SPHN|nr:YbjN domain-containing protein [Sphingomicrobium sediminis]MCM8556892.1 YbjN domain-containing protein [Sphingomicrobium sediminis]
MALTSIALVASVQPAITDDFTDALVRQAARDREMTIEIAGDRQYRVDAPNGMSFTVRRTACNDNGRCQGLAMLKCWNDDVGISVATVNLFNQNENFGRAYKDRTQICYAAYAIANNGVTPAYIGSNLWVFSRRVAGFGSAIQNYM